jgi:hypothetical protein
MTNRVFLAVLGLVGLASLAPAQIPQLSSRPVGAAYTLYLNFGGFAFTGTWGGAVGGPTPGTTPAYDTDGNATTFSATEIANMRNVWSRVAEKYITLNVNVTTVDPAVAAGQSGSDALRQAYYDQTARLHHTVIGGPGGWFGGGGVSYVGVTQNSYTTAGFNSNAGRGYHTNWVFSAQAPSNLQFVAEATAHEDGHGLKLNHQSLYVGTTLTEYDPGFNGGAGVGTLAPIMGNSYSAQRGTWRRGAISGTNSPTAQNDLSLLLTNTGITTGATGAGGFMDSGIGHTRPTATALPVSGSNITAAAKGHIAPSSATPNPINEANYTTDYFSLVVPAGNTATLNIVLRSGQSTITAGTADPGATLNATFRLLDVNGNVLQTSNSGVLTETLTVTAGSPLPAGTYYLQIASAGGATDPANGYQYYDVGSYFLTGTFTPVPEPATVFAVAAVGLAAAGGWRRWRSEAAPTTAV